MAFTPTIFSTGPKDDLITVDGYKPQENTPQGITTTNLASLYDELARTYIPNWSKFDIKLEDIIGKDAFGLLINAEHLLKGILSYASGIMGFFNNLPPSLKNLLLKVDGFNKVAVTLNGLTKYVTGTDYNTISSLAEMIKGISGCDFPVDVIDAKGRALLSLNLVRESSRAGIPGAYSAFINCITERYFGVTLTRGILPYIVESSDYDLLGQVADNSYAEYVKQYNPSFLNEFVSNFSLPNNTSSTDYDNILGSIQKSFGQLDPDWTSTSSLRNITQYTNYSKDFGKLLNASRTATPVDIRDPIESYNFSDTDSLNGILCLSKSNDYNFFNSARDVLSSAFPTVV